MPRRLESGTIADRRHQSRCGQRPHAGRGRKALAFIAALVPGEDLLLDLAELLGKCVEVLKQNHNGGTRLLRQKGEPLPWHV